MRESNQKPKVMKTVKVFEVRNDIEGRFAGVSPSSYIVAVDLDEAKHILGETKPSFKSHPQFYSLTETSLPVYTTESKVK